MTIQDRRSILIGLIGSGIGGSLSPAMHEREGRLQGLTYIYRTIDLDRLNLNVDDLEDLVLAAERLGFNGLNITHPCKQAVVTLLDDLSDVAAKIGAVNTVVFDGGRRIGHNTDAWGFAESFREEIAGNCPHDRIFLLGAGGAGTAVAHALLSRYSCKLEILDTDRKRLATLVANLGTVYGSDRVAGSTDVEESVGRCDGVINATPVGMNNHAGCPLDENLLRPDLWVADIIYFPLDTELVKAAGKVGCTVMKGGGMAVFQAARAFERFTGMAPDIGRMKSHFASLVGGPQVAPGSFRELSARK